MRLRGNTPETSLSPCFPLMFLFSTLLRRSTETKRLAQLCWEQSTFVIGLLPPILIKWCCSPLGREYGAKEKMWVCSCFLNSKGQPDWWNSAKPIASSVMQLASTASPGHTRVTVGGWWTLQRSHSPSLGHPSEKPLPLKFSLWTQRSSWVWRCSRRSLLFCCSPAKVLTQQQKD